MSINPNIKRSPARTRKAEYYLDGLSKGDRFVLSECITLAESQAREKRTLALEILNRVEKRPVESIRIGITGSPGVGKSTFLESLGTLLTRRGHRVAILAIDPSSRRTRGSILGDKTRMEKLAKDPGAFIRPTASGAQLGGIATATRESILLCEAAGFDIIFVETVGVGQSEIEVASVVDMFLLLMLPGAGDDIQGIKRGIMEMADLIVINKADGERLKLAEQSKRQFQQALSLLQQKVEDWNPVITTCSALEGTGLDTVWEEVLSFVRHSQDNGYFDANRKEQDLEWFDDKYTGLIREIFLRHNNRKEMVLELRKKISDGKITAVEAFQRLGREFDEEKM